MSRHTFNTTDLNNAPVMVIVGFDNPTESFYFQVHREGEIAEASIAMPEVEFDSVGLFKTLNGLGVALPVEIINTLAFESMFGGSNQTRTWPDHAKSEVEKALISAGLIQNMSCSLPSPSKCQWVLIGQDKDQYTIHFDEMHEVFIPHRLLTDEQAAIGAHVGSEKLLALLTAENLVKTS
jgi:hypothetical protein